MQPVTRSILSLDVGAKRIGIAIATLESRLPRPLVTLTNDGDFIQELTQILEKENVDTLVVGLPRGLDGQETMQTYETSAFVSRLGGQIELPIHMQDEALTSQKAKDELESRGKPYQKGDVDALAATYILQDFLADNPEVKS